MGSKQVTIHGVMFYDDAGGGGGYPSHPIFYPPYPDNSLPPFPSHPIAPGGGGGRPSHPIFYPPYPDQGLPPFPSHPIAPGGGGVPGYPSHPIFYPPFPSHPIVLPPPGGGTTPPPPGNAGQLPGSDPGGSGWVWAYVPGYGWMWAMVPPAPGSQPHPEHPIATEPED